MPSPPRRPDNLQRSSGLTVLPALLMELGEKISAVLQIRPTEGRPIAILLCISFLLGLAYVLADTASSTLLISHFDTSVLPFLYMAIAVAVPMAGASYAWLSERFSFKQLTLASILFLIVSVVILAALLTFSDIEWPILVYFVWVEVFYVLLGLAFWGMAGRMFNVRQGKRLFGIITTGEVAAMVLMGAFIIPRLVKTIPVVALLWVQAGVLTLLFVAIAVVWRVFHTRLIHNAEEEESKSAIAELLRNRYIVLLLLVSALSIMAFYVLDNIFYTSVSAQFVDEERLVVFFGRFFAATAAFTLVTNLLVTGRLLGNFGVRISMLVLPIALLAGAILTLISGLANSAAALVFGIVVLMRAIDEIGRYSISESTTRVVYQPLPLRQRVQAQALAEGVGMPIAIGLTGVGLALLVFIFGNNVWILTLVLTLVLAMWVLVSNRLGREYLTALVQASSRRILGENQALILDKTALDIIQTRLTSEHPGEIVYALELLRNCENTIDAATAERLLDHPDAAVRLAVLQTIGASQDAHYTSLIRDHIAAETETLVRAASLAALIEVDRDKAIDDVMPYLSAPDAALQSKAIAALLNFGGESCRQTAIRRLELLAASSDTADRVIAAQALCEAGDFAPGGFITALLDDPMPEVRRGALQAAGKTHDARFAPILLDHLLIPQYRTAAHFALIDLGAAAVPALQMQLLDPVIPARICTYLAQILGSIGTDEAVAALLDAVAADAHAVRWAALSALHRQQVRAPADFQHQDRVEEAIAGEMSEITWKMAVLVDLATDSFLQPLRRALEYEIRQGLDNCLNALALISDTDKFRRAQRNLRNPSSDQRAYALEIIETLLPENLRRPHIVLFEDAALETCVLSMAQHFPQRSVSSIQRLQSLLGPNASRINPWTRACAIYAAASAQHTNLEKQVRQTLQHPDPIITETSCWAIDRWERPFEHGENDMMLTIEKVIILRTAAVFVETPDEILADVAQVAEEVSYQAGEMIIRKDEIGSTMFVIVSGGVRVHDGDRTLAELGERDFFGELALLDAEPRSASVTAQSDTLLLRIDQDAFYELMDERIEVTRGVLKVLACRIREVNARMTAVSAVQSSDRAAGG